MILVTGASGHVGRHLVEELVRQHEEVRVLVRKDYTGSNKVEVVKGDILDEEAVKRATKGVEVIYHLAAIVDYHPAPRQQTYDVNVLGTRNVLKYSEAEKFIYQSSTAVYGRKHKNPATENTPYHPYSYYGQTKVMAEKLVLEKGGIVIRCPAIYGPGFNEGYYFMLAQIQKGKMPIVGSGENRMQWIYISDLIQALILAKDKGKKGEVYLVGGKETETQAELAALAAKYLGVDRSTKHVSTNSAYALAYYKLISAKLRKKESKLEPEHIRKITADRTFDISKAKRELGFQPKTGWDEGMKEMVEEFRRMQAH